MARQGHEATATVPYRFSTPKVNTPVHRSRGRWTGCGARRWQQRSQGNPSGWWSARSTSSGNRAFDEYRADTLRRLEEEQREFKEFLDRLRHAKDKAEFDQFMAERRRRNGPPEPQAEPSQA